MTELSNEDLESRKQFYKMLLAPSMSMEEKLDELWDVPEADLRTLLAQFQADEDYEICQAISKVLEDRPLSRI